MSDAPHRGDYAVRSEDYGSSIDITQAETRRQAQYIEGLKRSHPELYDRALKATIEFKKAQAHLEQVKIELAHAVTPGQMGDVLTMLNRDSALALNQQAQSKDPTLSQAGQKAQTDKATQAA